MSVRKRTWKNAKGEKKDAWIVDYVDQRSFDPIYDPTRYNRV